MKNFVIAVITLFFVSPVCAEEYIGKLSVNPYAPDSTAGAGANNYRIKQSMQDQYSTGGPRLYNDEGSFRGNLNGNQYDVDSISNPYGRYGSSYSAESINNPYGAGSKYKVDSPNNPYGTGLTIIDD